MPAYQEDCSYWIDGTCKLDPKGALCECDPKMICPECHGLPLAGPSVLPGASTDRTCRRCKGAGRVPVDCCNG